MEHRVKLWPLGWVPVSPSARAEHPNLMNPYSSRREFLQAALAALPAAALMSSAARLNAADAKPNSKVAGVQIGINVPYSFANALMSGDDILKNCIELNLSAVELRTQPVEAFLGVPERGVAKTKAE